MTLPESARHAVEAALSAYSGQPEQLSEVQELGGGCISRATRITTARGTRAFLKYDAQAALPPGIFDAEADALEEIRSTHTARVPAVIATSNQLNASLHPAALTPRRPDAIAPRHPDGAPPQWLLLEWLEPGRPSASSWEHLGRAVAALHRNTRSSYGRHAPNFIGTLPQSNRWTDAWPEFWRAERIEPQLQRASAAGYLCATDTARVAALLDDLSDVLESDELQPSLLHGDLWNGNVHAVADGEAALIDPASYYGHREVDLAMADLFGGFDDRFFDAYDEAWPRAHGYQRRRLAYQLYYLLVHVNMFGGSYLAGTMSVIGKLGF